MQSGSNVSRRCGAQLRRATFAWAPYDALPRMIRRDLDGLATFVWPAAGIDPVALCEAWPGIMIELRDAQRIATRGAYGPSHPGAIKAGELKRRYAARARR